MAAYDDLVQQVRDNILKWQSGPQTKDPMPGSRGPYQSSGNSSSAFNDALAGFYKRRQAATQSRRSPVGSSYQPVNYEQAYSRTPYNPGSTGSGTLDQLMKKIGGQESGNNYRARNKSSGALGKYQIMPGNLSGWGREAIGRPVSANEFYNSPELQEKIAQYKLNQYMQKYGMAGAAQAWYAGEGSLKRSQASLNRKQGAYPSINSYVQQVMGR